MGQTLKKEGLVDTIIVYKACCDVHAYSFQILVRTGSVETVSGLGYHQNGGFNLA